MIRGWRYISTLLMAVVMLLSPLNVVGAGAALTPQGGTYVYDATSLPYDAPSDGAPRTLGELAGAWTNDDGTTGAVGLATGSNQISVWWPRSFVAPNSTRFFAGNGPLDEAVAGTFRSGTYDEVLLSQDTLLYRVYGGEAGPIGGYWSRTAPSGPMQGQMDSALNPAWGNLATDVSTIRVPAGTTIY
jgi:hypothetical protein